MKPEDKQPQQGGTRKYDAEAAKHMREKRKALDRNRRKKSAKPQAATVEREVYLAKEHRFKTMKVPVEQVNKSQKYQQAERLRSLNVTK